MRRPLVKGNGISQLERKAQRGKTGLNKTTMTVSCPFQGQAPKSNCGNEEVTAVRRGVSESRHNWHELVSTALAVKSRDGHSKVV